MKKNKVKAQLRKIATREAIEKRRNSKPADPFMLLLGNKNRTTAREEYDDYDYNEEEQDYGF